MSITIAGKLTNKILLNRKGEIISTNDRDIL